MLRLSRYIRILLSIHLLVAKEENLMTFSQITMQSQLKYAHRKIYLTHIMTSELINSKIRHSSNQQIKNSKK